MILRYIILLILVQQSPFWVKAQEQATLIKVTARVVHLDPSPVYKAMVSLSGSYSSFPAEMTTLEILEKRYKEALELKGIAWSDLKMNPTEFGFESMGYGREGTLYEYKTTSVENMKKFMETSSLGMQLISYVSVFTIDENEATLLSQKALTKARASANIIAKSMGKKVVEIKEVEDLNNRWGENVENSIFYDRPSAEYIYMINVIFRVE